MTDSSSGAGTAAASDGQGPGRHCLAAGGALDAGAQPRPLGQASGVVAATHSPTSRAVAGVTASSSALANISAVP